MISFKCNFVLMDGISERKSVKYATIFICCYSVIRNLQIFHSILTLDSSVVILG